MIHPFEPVYDLDSRVLILGTFPSVKSRENGFYYGHPQNRFWRVISALLDTELPLTNEAKKTFLLSHKIALWDVLHSCEIIGSSDASITQALPNDIQSLIKNSKISLICLNGQKAAALFRSFNPDCQIEVLTLPSTSAANAAITLDQLIYRWAEVLKPIFESDLNKKSSLKTDK